MTNPIIKPASNKFGSVVIVVGVGVGSKSDGDTVGDGDNDISYSWMINGCVTFDIMEIK